MASPEPIVTVDGLSPQEWVVLFPRQLFPTRNVGDTRDPLEDPAENLRAEHPLTSESVLRTISSEPLLLTLTKVNFALGPWASKAAFRLSVFHLLTLGTVVWLWKVNDETLGNKQLIAG
jgi:hypothetical protein